MNKTIYLVISSIFLFLSSCDKTKDKYEIHGSFIGFTENSKVIISDTDTGEILDTTRLVGNQFSSTGFINEPPILINIAISSDNEESAFAMIYIGNETVHISGDKKDFPGDLKISGSKHQDFKTKLDSELNPLIKKRDEYLQNMFSLRQEGMWNDSLQKEYWSKESGLITKIDIQTEQITEKFIEENINSHYALYQLIIYKTEFSNTFIMSQIEKLNSDFNNSRYANVLRTYLEFDPLNKGDIFYDFVAENRDGQSVMFSEYFNTKYVLLEFCSSYCSWCKKAIPEIMNLSKQDEDKLEIVTFNVDKSKEDWVNNIDTNKITWSSINDNSGRFSDTYTKYRVFVTPTYYLFDKKGALVEKWDGYNENMIEQIKESIKIGE